MTTGDPEDTGLEALLEFLKSTRGFDFSGYKRTSLERRLAKRMEAVGLEDYPSYVDYLQVHPDEYAELFNTILINVTSFFRDPTAWEYVEQEALPRLLEAKGEDEEIRVWSAGTASGQEAYTIAMLLVKTLGEKAYLDRVKVYATDADELALAEARTATWTARQVAGVPPDLLERCFERIPQGYAFRKDLRRALIFGRNDLVQDAPISRVDALLCRNTLMYFTAETQARVLERFNFSLTTGGFLFLGKSEMLLTHGDLFKPQNLKHRVFEKVPRRRARPPLSFFSESGPPETANGYGWLRDGAFDVSPVAQVVVDRAGALVLANQRARKLFGLDERDLGRPLQDLEVSYRPIELRAALDRAYESLADVPLGTTLLDGRPPEEERRLDVLVAPLLDGDGGALGAGVLFTDVTEQATMNDELERAKRELEVAYEELQSSVEELETTNEELQSTNEELETTNEELQSTNEELETTNEELESTNEELETINNELRDRTTELRESNGALEAVLGSLDVAIAVVDPRTVVQVWSARAADLWGLRDDEVVGQGIFALDIGLPVDRLRDPLRQALRGEEAAPLELTAVERRGRTMSFLVRCVPLRDGDAVSGSIVLMSVVDR